MAVTPGDQIFFYGTDWCPSSRRSKSILDSHNITYEYINIDKDSEGRRFVEKTNNGYRSVPTIVFPDGSILVEPTRRELSKKLGK